MDDLATSLGSVEWQEIADSFRATEMQLFLPRFRMAYERTLNDDLAALGMVDAFDHRADFTRLSPVDGLLISEVKQKSWIDVNEEGTETVCTNDECLSPSEVCPECRKGVLVLKQGRTQFWGCSRYWDEPSCTYARTATNPM